MRARTYLSFGVNGTFVDLFNILFRPELLRMFPFFFTSLAPFRLLCEPAGTVSAVLHLRGPELGTAVDIVENMRREQLNFAAGHEVEMFAGFCRLMVHILRHAVAPGKTERGTLFRLERTVHYLEKTLSLLLFALACFDGKVRQK